MRESCAGYMIAAGALVSVLWASLLGFTYRAGFNFGVRTGFSNARARILAIVDKLKMRELFGDLLEDLERGEE